MGEGLWGGYTGKHEVQTITLLYIIFDGKGNHFIYLRQPEIVTISHTISRETSTLFMLQLMNSLPVYVCISRGGGGGGGMPPNPPGSWPLGTSPPSNKSLIEPCLQPEKGTLPGGDSPYGPLHVVTPLTPDTPTLGL